MKRIEAIIKCFKFDAVKEALMEIGVVGMTVIEVKGFGRQKGHTEIYRGSEYTVDCIPKALILLFATDEAAPQIVETIITSSRTGKTGDGVVIISEIAHAFQIRTGESGEVAL